MNEEARKKHLKKQNIIAAAILVGGTILSFLIFSPDRSKSQETPSAVRAAALVKTVTLGEKQTKTAALVKTATFVSTDSANVVAEISGRIRNTNFEVGIFVEKGQVLAFFDQDEDENSAKVNLSSAERSFAITLENLEKTRDLTRENEELAKNARKIAEIQLEQAEDLDDGDQEDITRRNLENAKDFEDQTEHQSQLLINNAQLQVSQARAAIDSAKVQFENTIIKAPISGLVTSKFIEDDQFVVAGSNITQIVGSGKLETTISLSDTQVDRIRTGDDVEIEISSKKYMGEIVSYSPVARSGNQRYDVKIQTYEELTGEANKSGKVTVALYLDETVPDTFFVPLEAVNIGQRKTVVFIAEDGKAVSREVKTGEIIGSQIEVIEGLSAGDSLIIENSRNLQEGQQVTLTSTE